MANRFTRFIGALGIAWCSIAVCGEPNQLTPGDKAQGWQLLFDGQTIRGWTSYRKAEAPVKGWSAREGWLVCEGSGGGDLVSDREFDDFELEWEWKLPPMGNSGVKYFVLDSRNSPIGHEYQMIDDRVELDGKPVRGKHATGAFYAILAPTQYAERPIGETNYSRVLVKGTHVEHWLNGTKVLEYECGSPEVMGAVATSKFKNDRGFGQKVKGRILLQDHQTGAWFRNLRIRPL